MSAYRFLLYTIFCWIPFLPLRAQQPCESGNCDNGNGKTAMADGTRYEGAFKNGRFEGYGKATLPNGDTYEGSWKNGRRHGQGIYKKTNGEWYEGGWKNNVKYGDGIYTWTDGSTYVGEWYSDRPYGKGAMAYTDGNTYKGNWEDGKYQGKGTFEWRSGERFVGLWKDHAPAEGLLYFADGERYDGSWKTNMVEGQPHYVFISSTLEVAQWAGHTIADLRPADDEEPFAEKKEQKKEDTALPPSHTGEIKLVKNPTMADSAADPLLAKYSGDFDIVMRELEAQKQDLSEKGIRIREEMERIAERLETEQLDQEQKAYLEGYLHTLEQALIDTELALQDAIERTSELITRMKRTIIQQHDEIDEITEEKNKHQSKYRVVAVLASIALLASLVLFFILRAINKQKKKIERQKIQIEAQKAEIEKQNDNITASITYARRIQKALLPNQEGMQELLPNSFTLLKPRDIVSGDFYWFGQEGDKLFIAAVDCTGHGVPGAFMSLVGNTLLHDIIHVDKVSSPELILEALHAGVSQRLKQDTLNAQDGMDIALCVIDTEHRVLSFAGAKSPLFIVEHRRLTEVKGSPFPIGGMQKKEEQRFSRYDHVIQPGQQFYIFSDGFRDQFGGPQHKKLMKKGFKDLLLQLSDYSPEEQRTRLQAFWDGWVKGHKQLDDILVIGFKPL